MDEKNKINFIEFKKSLVGTTPGLIREGLFLNDSIHRHKSVIDLLEKDLYQFSPGSVSAFRLLDSTKKVKKKKPSKLRSIFDLPKDYWYFVDSRFLYDKEFVLGLETNKSFDQAIIEFYKDLENKKQEFDVLNEEGMYHDPFSRELTPVRILETDYEKNFVVLQYFIKSVPFIKIFSTNSNKLVSSTGDWADLYLAALGHLSPATIPNCLVNSNTTKVRGSFVKKYSSISWLMSNSVIKLAEKNKIVEKNIFNKNIDFFISPRDKNKSNIFFGVILPETEQTKLLGDTFPAYDPDGHGKSTEFFSIPSSFWTKNFHNDFNDPSEGLWRIHKYHELKNISTPDVSEDDLRYGNRLEPSIKRASSRVPKHRSFVCVNMRPDSDAIRAEKDFFKKKQLITMEQKKLERLKEQLKESRVSLYTTSFLSSPKRNRYPYFIFSGVPYLHNPEYDVKLPINFRYYVEEDSLLAEYIEPSTEILYVKNKAIQLPRNHSIITNYLKTHVPGFDKKFSKEDKQYHVSMDFITPYLPRTVINELGVENESSLIAHKQNLIDIYEEQRKADDASGFTRKRPRRTYNKRIKAPKLSRYNIVEGVPRFPILTTAKAIENLYSLRKGDWFFLDKSFKHDNVLYIDTLHLPQKFSHFALNLNGKDMTFKTFQELEDYIFLSALNAKNRKNHPDETMRPTDLSPFFTSDNSPLYKAFISLAESRKFIEEKRPHVQAIKQHFEDIYLDKHIASREAAVEISYFFKKDCRALRSDIDHPLFYDLPKATKDKQNRREIRLDINPGLDSSMPIHNPELVKESYAHSVYLAFISAICHSYRHFQIRMYTETLSNKQMFHILSNCAWTTRQLYDPYTQTGVCPYNIAFESSNSPTGIWASYIKDFPRAAITPNGKNPSRYRMIRNNKLYFYTSTRPRKPDSSWIAEVDLDNRTARVNPRNKHKPRKLINYTDYINFELNKKYLW